MKKLSIAALFATIIDTAFSQSFPSIPKSKHVKFNYRSNNTAFTRGKRHASQRSRANSRKV